MDLLVFDEKRNRKVAEIAGVLNKEELIGILGDRKVDAFLNGGLVQIFDEIASQVIYDCAGIGQWLDDGRNENKGVSKTCFNRDEDETHFGATKNSKLDKKTDEKEAKKWADLSPDFRSLVLSPLETVLLSIEWQIINVKKGQKVLTNEEVWVKMREYDNHPALFGNIYAVFRFLKTKRWIVSNGLSFGCDFLIYCLGAQFYHSSAGVLVADVIEPQRLLTLTRILAHNKKALIVATTSKNVQNFEEVSSVEVRTVTMKTYFLERDVAQISNQMNEIYDLKCIDR